jgi:hypothetical protein
LSELTVQQVVAEINAVHRDLAKLSVDQLLGTPSALKTEEVLQLHSLPLASETTEFLRAALASSHNAEEFERIERILFGCLDLALVKETAMLGDMLRFYMERGRMIVGRDKIPALEVVPWLQAQTDFAKREEIGKEMTIFLKAIVNPILMGMIELSSKAVHERFGFKNYVSFCEAKKGASFADQATAFDHYLDATTDVYFRRIRPWVEEKLGRPLDHLSRYHALHLLRISRFDESFPASRLRDIVSETFSALGLNPSSRPDVVLDLSDDPVKNPDGICIGVEIPGEIYVLIKPAGGLIDVEALLHEMGHAFFLSHFDPDLPVEYRRLYRSPALDETFAFLFMNLVGNKAWLTGPGGLSSVQADKLADLYGTKRLCLIRRYIGKFFAQKELYENGNIKNSDPYCRYLNRATGFIYEPEGYLIDMESDFYALDYLNAWAGANTLGGFLESRFGENWFQVPDAGDLLRQIAAAGRRELLEPVIQSVCGQPPRLPEFS